MTASHCVGEAGEYTVAKRLGYAVYSKSRVKVHPVSDLALVEVALDHARTPAVSHLKIGSSNGTRVELVPTGSRARRGVARVTERLESMVRLSFTHGCVKEGDSGSLLLDQSGNPRYMLTGGSRLCSGTQLALDLSHFVRWIYDT